MPTVDHKPYVWLNSIVTPKLLKVYTSPTTFQYVAGNYVRDDANHRLTIKLTPGALNLNTLPLDGTVGFDGNIHFKVTIQTLNGNGGLLGTATVTLPGWWS